MAAAAILLDELELYDEGHFRMDRGYLYVTIINNLSVTISFFPSLQL
jgi:hypothetical protein